MTARWLPLLVLLLAAPEALAQRVAGRVYEATDTGEAPVPGATVRLVAGADTVAATAADATGRYLLRAPGAGAYRVVVTAVGYGRAEGDSLALAEGEARIVDVELAPSLDVLGDVSVEARREPLHEVGFYRRKGQGQGRFIDRQQIEDRRPRVLSDLFNGMPGFIPLHSEGDVRVASINYPATRGTNCRPTVVVDGAVLRSFGSPIPGTPEEDGLPTNPMFNLDRALRVDEVEAVEAYAHGGIPAQYGGTMSPCGAILIWTRYHAAQDAGDSGGQR